MSDDLIKEALTEASLFFGQGKHKQQTLPIGKCKYPQPLIINVDGASKGNPGVSAAGVLIVDAKGKDVARIKRFLGVMTNNQAEYNALIIGLTEALNLDCAMVKIYMDSQLAVRQINGQYKVKNQALRPLYDSAMRLLKKFESYDIIHIQRSYNQIADSLANEAIKEHVSSERTR